MVVEEARALAPILSEASLYRARDYHTRPILIGMAPGTIFARNGDIIATTPVNNLDDATAVLLRYEPPSRSSIIN
jgi:hypothetical protein